MIKSSLLLQRDTSMKKLCKISGTSGSTLIEVVVTSSVLLIMTMAIISVTTNQNKELSALNEKLALFELERVLQSNINDSCTAELSNSLVNAAAPYLINSTTTIHLNHLHASSQSGAPKIVEVGNLTPTIKINDILVDNFISSGPNKYLADLTIKIDQSKLIRSRKPIKLRLTVNTNATNRVVSCSGVEYSAYNCATKTQPFQASPSGSGSGIGLITCDAGMRAVGGGGICHTGGGHYLMTESVPVGQQQWSVKCCSYNQGTGHLNCYQGHGQIFVTCCP